MTDQITYYHCDSHMGVSGTTRLAIKKHSNGYEARIGIALLGSTNMDEEDFRACNYDPFHPEFHDNYATGIGRTEEQAIERLKADMNSIADSIWAE